MSYIGSIVGVFGGIFSALLGGDEGRESFDPRNMFSAIIRGGIVGLALSVEYEISAPVDYIVLFLATVGVDFWVFRSIIQSYFKQD